MKKVLTRDVLRTILIRLSSGDDLTISDIANEMGMVPSSISRRLASDFPTEHAMLVRDGKIRRGKRASARTLDRQLAAARESEAVAKIFDGHTYEEVTQAYGIARGTLQRMVALVREHDKKDPVNAKKKKRANRPRLVGARVTGTVGSAHDPADADVVVDQLTKENTTN